MTILVNGLPKKMTVAVLIEAEGPAQALEGHFGIMDIAQAQEVFGKVGALDRIDLLLKEGGTESDQIRELEKVIPSGGPSDPADRSGKRDGTDDPFLSIESDGLSFIAVLVSMYLIYNTASLSVVRRRKELGTEDLCGCCPDRSCFWSF